jgi:hypothetical protein
LEKYIGVVVVVVVVVASLAFGVEKKVAVENTEEVPRVEVAASGQMVR